VSARALTAAFVALVVLAAASFALSYADLGRYAMAVALLVAAAKGALVLAVFMELAHEPPSSRLAVVAAGSLLVILVALVFADVATREAPPIVVEPGATLGDEVKIGPSRPATEGAAKRSAGNGEGALRP
jgi:caa(3)-type oxidase subunit IV